MATPPAGWYPDPESPNQMRYWDGGQWTLHRAPAAAAASPEPATEKMLPFGAAPNMPPRHHGPPQAGQAPPVAPPPNGPQRPSGAIEWVRRNRVAAAAIAAGFGGLLLGAGLGAAGAQDSAKTEAAAVKEKTVTETTTVDKVRTVKARPKTKTKTVTVTNTETVTSPSSGDNGGGGGDNCSPEYTGACIPANADDVDCGDVDADNFQSVGSDPYILDLDSDGVACES
jgi:hypothetical protein